MDLIEIPRISEPRLAPGRDGLLFLRSDADWEANRRVSSLWWVDLDDEDEPGEPLRLTPPGLEEVSEPRWGPEGRRIAFLARPPGPDSVQGAARDTAASAVGAGARATGAVGGRRGSRPGALDTARAVQIFLMEAEGLPARRPTARRLTAHPTSVSGIAWSPDGRWIYFLASDPPPAGREARTAVGNDVYSLDREYTQRHLWRVEVETGREERLTEGDHSVWEYRLGREGRRLVLRRAPSPLIEELRATELWVASADGSDPVRVTRNEAPEEHARLSPDGRRLLFVSMADETLDFYYEPNLFVADVPGPEEGPAEPGRRPGEGPSIRLHLFDMRHAVEAAEWSEDGRAIYLLVNMGVRQELFRYDLETRERILITEGNHTVTDWSYLPDENRHVFRIESPESPGDVWSLERRPDLEEGRLRRLTTLYAELTRRFTLPRVEAVRWNGDDNVPVEGLLYYPLDYARGVRFPLVVQAHGGPMSSDRFRFEFEWDYPQVLAALGWFVLKPNYRGSIGYGDRFMRDMVGHYFNQAHLDVLSGAQTLATRGLVDPERVVMMGWSAGGHMTNLLVAASDFFAAASSGAGAANWISMYGQTDLRSVRIPWFGGTPWEEGAPIDVYWTHSPLSLVAGAVTPTLLLVGEEDRRVPMAQSVEMFRALRSQGVATRLHVAPREGHVWRELRHRLFKANVELDWFERIVRGRSYRWETAPGDPPEAAPREAGEPPVGGPSPGQDPAP